MKKALGILCFAFVMGLVVPSAFAANHGHMKGQFNKGKVEWPMVPNAQKIHMFYREKGMTHWPFAQPDLHGSNTSVHLNFLKRGVAYEARPLIRMKDGTWMWGPILPVQTMPM